LFAKESKLKPASFKAARKLSGVLNEYLSWVYFKLSPAIGVSRLPTK
jgi:hypothetical protein